MRMFTKQNRGMLCVVSIILVMLTACTNGSMSITPVKELSQRSAQDVALQQARTTAQKELTQFQSVIPLMQQDGADVSLYQQQCATDQTMLRNAKSVADLQSVTQQLEGQMAPSQLPLAQALAKYLVQSFHQEATNWGNTHQYQDAYSGKSYPYDFEYLAQPDDYGAGLCST
ncbi:hypothetical protein ccbrp13_30740 [Ktedonobacteria bacterium brp13]|nr:hypothetical protein ccbrp13_30740 [Ktedonobacteria bacterium brp13]